MEKMAFAALLRINPFPDKLKDCPYAKRLDMPEFLMQLDGVGQPIHCWLASSTVCTSRQETLQISGIN